MTTTITFTVVFTKFSSTTFPPAPGKSTNYSLAAPDFNDTCERLRKDVAQQLLALDATADADTTCTVAFS